MIVLSLFEDVTPYCSFSSFGSNETPVPESARFRQLCMVRRPLLSSENIGFVIDTAKRYNRPETRDWNAMAVEINLTSREPNKP